MLESNYVKIYTGNFIIAQLIFDKLDEIGINPILKDDNQTGLTAVMVEDYQALIEVYVHKDEENKAMPVVEDILSRTTTIES
jgi:hypothetical protein